MAIRARPHIVFVLCGNTGWGDSIAEYLNIKPGQGFDRYRDKVGAASR